MTNQIQTTVQGFPVRTTGAGYLPRRALGIQALAQWKGENQDAPEHWLRLEIGMAFQQMVCLGLSGQPAAEMLPLTAEMWVQTIGIGLIADIDRERIRKGFARLYRKLKQWPQPAELLEALPPRPERAKIAAQHSEMTEEEHAQASAKFDELMTMFDKGEFKKESNHA